MRLRFAIGYCIPAAVAVFVATLPAIRSSELSFAPPFGLALWFCSGLLVTFFAPMAWSNKISHGEYVRIGIRSILRLGPVCLGTLVVGFARNAPAEMALLFAVVSAVLIDLARSFAPAASVLQAEPDLHVHQDLDGLTVEQRRAELPLPHGIGGRLPQFGMRRRTDHSY